MLYHAGNTLPEIPQKDGESQGVSGGKGVFCDGGWSENRSCRLVKETPLLQQQHFAGSLERIGFHAEEVDAGGDAESGCVAAAPHGAVEAGG